MLEHASRQDPVTAEYFKNEKKITAPPAPPQLSATVATSVKRDVPVMQQVLRKSDQGKSLLRRPPTFWDGVVMGLLCSIMGCYVPQKPLHTYYNMSFGMR